MTAPGMTLAQREAVMGEMYAWALGHRTWLGGKVGPSHVEDIIQQASFEAWRYLATGVDAVTYPKALMLRFTRFAIGNYFAHKTAHTDLHEDVGTELEDYLRSPEPSIVDRLIATEERRGQKVICITAMQKLKPDEREILHRFYVQHQSKEFIQAAMGLDKMAFRNRKWRAKARLELVTRNAA